MALLALVMPPAHAAALLVVPSLLTNIWQSRPYSEAGPPWRALRSMPAGIVLGTLGTAWVLGAPAGAWAEVALGVALVAFAGWSLVGAQARVRPSSTGWISPLIGVLTGVATAATGVFVMPAVPYLQALGLRRAALMQAMGISFTVSTAALAAGLHMNGQYAPAQLGMSALLLVPALAGMAIGQAIAGRLSQAVFKRCLMASLALLGLHMIVRELWLS